MNARFVRSFSNTAAKKGGASILHLRGVDVGFVQSDAVLYANQHKLFDPKDAANIQYIAKLYDEEVHIIARPEITSVSDLAGKRISVDVQGSGTAMTAEIILSSLGINATISHMRHSDGVEALKNGQIDAIIHVGGAPIPLLAGIPSGDLHLVPLPLSNGLGQTYLPAELTHDE